MQCTLSRFGLAMACAGLVTIYGCGGGGGGNANSSTPTTAITTLSGIAATGAAFEGATITVTDSTNTVVGTSAAIGVDGTFSITLSSGALAPFVLTATRTNADGATESLVSMVPAGTGTTASAAVNISPVTNLIASRLSPSGDPTKLASEVAAGTATVNTTTVAAKVTEVQTILAPILTATGTTNTNPLTGTFATDGTGYDRLLDSIKVTITPASTTSTNVEVAVKQQQAEGVAPVALPPFINGASQTPLSSIGTLPAANTYTLLPSGTSAKIAAHLAQLNSCYALASSTRVPSGTSASSISAPACLQAFYGDDPTNFLSGGKTVSSTGAFSSIFNSGVQNVVFSQGNYEFTRANGDIVVSYKSRTPSGAESYDTFALREDTDGKLKQIGNQYTYGGGVTAYHQIRRFPHLNQSASDYYSTGYSISIPKTGLDHVAVITPRGNTLILKQQTGYDNLQLVLGWGGTADTPTGGTQTGTSFVRVRSEYVDQANTADPGATSDGSRLFFAATPFTNTEIAQIPAQAVWTVKYYTTGSPNTVAATQYYKTRARALTIPELRTQVWSALTATQLNDLAAVSIPDAPPPSAAGQVPVIDSRASFALAYTVPSGALPPTSLQIWGKYYNGTNWSTSPNFSDSSPVSSTARSGNVTCANAGGGDVHCGVGGGAFANPTRINGIHLWSRDPGGREFANFYALYQL